jgi:hypothetical protein
MTILALLAGRVRTWFQGRKTMLGGLTLIAAAIAGVATGQLSVEQGVVILGFGVSICGWSAKENRHQAEVLAALTAVAQAGVQARNHTFTTAAKTIENAVIAEALTAATERAKTS